MQNVFALFEAPSLWCHLFNDMQMNKCWLRLYSHVNTKVLALFEGAVALVASWECMEDG